MKRLLHFLGGLLLFSNFITLSAEEKQIILSVEDSLELAQRHSRTIRSAAIDLDSQADARNHALNAFLPDISFSGTIARPNEYDSTYADMLNPLYQNAGMGNPIPSDWESEADKYSVVGSASISVNWGLSIIEKVKKANIDYKNGLITWEQTIRQNKRDVKKLFYSLLLQQKTLENNKISLENTFKRYESTEKSYASGGTSKINVLQSKVTYQNLKRDVEKEEIAFNRQLREFASILGISPAQPIILQGTLESEQFLIDREKLLSLHTAYNSQIKSLSLQVESVKTQMRGLNLDSWTPNLSFNYSTKKTMSAIDKDWFDGSSWSDKGNVSMSLTWNFTNILPFSNNRIKYHDLERQKEKLELQLEQKRDDILLDMQEIFDDLETSAVSLKSCRENILLAEESYALISQAYNAGSADLIAVRDAEEELNKSQLAEKSELFTYISSLADLEFILELPENWQETIAK